MQTMQTDVLLTSLSNKSEQVEFQQVINTIDEHYDDYPSKFSNENTVNVLISKTT